MRIYGLRFVFLALLPVWLGGCANLGHYVQAVGGQMEIMRRSQPIETVINDSQTPAPLKQKLAAVLQIRDFASQELGLPENGSYRNYADLQRPYVTWNVFATPEFSTKPKVWCFLVAGCVNYRGYFSREEAEAYGNSLRSQGYDVLVAGIPAYSTLGHFNDPVLNTFVQYRETEIARLIFHELGHQIAYVGDDSVFNESLATAVEQEGLRRWAVRGGKAGQDDADAVRLQRKDQITMLVMQYRNRLDELYASPLDDAKKRQGKAEILGELLKDHEALKLSWGGHSEFDAWFSHNLNNAKIASLSLYTQLVPTFRALLARHGDNLPDFYEDVRKIATLPKDERARKLHELTDQSFYANAQDRSSHTTF